jgi:hypothetical protein
MNYRIKKRKMINQKEKRLRTKWYEYYNLDKKSEKIAELIKNLKACALYQQIRRIIM